MPSSGKHAAIDQPFLHHLFRPAETKSYDGYSMLMACAHSTVLVKACPLAGCQESKCKTRCVLVENHPIDPALMSCSSHPPSVTKSNSQSFGVGILKQGGIGLEKRHSHCRTANSLSFSSYSYTTMVPDKAVDKTVCEKWVLGVRYYSIDFILIILQRVRQSPVAAYLWPLTFIQTS
jgi:hypothetical protein